MTTPRWEYRNGTKVYWQDHRKRIIEAIGKDVVDPFGKAGFSRLAVDDTTGDPTEWTCTAVEAGTGNSTFTQADASGGAAVITTDDNENDGVNAQLNGESFKLKSTNIVYFGAFGVKLSEATQSDLFLGLAVTDTDILGNAPARIGFQKVDGSTDLKFVLKQASETLSVALHTVEADTEMDLEFYWDGATIEVLINGVSVLKPAVANKPTGELRVSWHFLSGAAGTPLTCQWYRPRAIQVGR